MDYPWMSGPLLCVLSGLGHWFLSWVSAPCYPSTISIKWNCAWKQHNILCNFTQDLYISQVTYCQLITSFPSVTEKDLLYAANWAVSLLQVTQDFFTGTAIWSPFQASVVTIIGVVGCFYTGFDTSAKDLPVRPDFKIQICFSLEVCRSSFLMAGST